MEITLRPFRRHDFETLWKIDQECFPPGIAYTKHELSNYIQRRSSLTLVAEAADSHFEQNDQDRPASGIVGFIVSEATPRGVGHIITVDVLPLARRFGTGSKLLVSAEHWLHAGKCFRVRLEAAVNNEPALAFYRRHGYRIVATIPNYYDNGLDAYTLEKGLENGHLHVPGG